MPEVKRTLVKSAPELWAEIGDGSALARHLAPFGSVRITATDPERLVEWEGDRAAGAIRLEPSGFGTRVRATWQVIHLSPPPAPKEPEPQTEPADDAAPPATAAGPVSEPVRRSFWGRFRRRRAAVAPPPEPVAEPEPEPQPEPIVTVQAATPEPPPAPQPPAPDPLAMTDESAAAVLTELLDALGSAHHRPFSRI